MASSYIRTTAVGNVGRDPEASQAGEHTKVTFSLAVNEWRKDEESTTWLNCVAWGKLAEIIGDNLSKGDRVFVSGPFRSYTWTDKNGMNRTGYELTVRDYVPMRAESSQDGPRKPRREQPRAKDQSQSWQAPEGFGSGGDDLADLPF